VYEIVLMLKKIVGSLECLEWSGKMHCDRNDVAVLIVMRLVDAEKS
jgi:hypothetical protein